MRTAKACAALFKMRVAEQLQYRMAAFANSSIGIFWGVLQIVMITVFYTFGSENNAAITLSQAITYMWLVQILLGIINNLNIDGDIRGQITSGNLAVELCRPLDLYAHWFAKTAANRLGSSFWRGVIILIVALIAPAAYRLSVPYSAVGFGLFLISVFSAFILCTAVAMFLTAVRVGLTWGEGPTYALAMVGGFLSGAFLPLPLWPDFLQGALLFQPFAGLMDIPFRLYIGVMPPSDAVWAIGLQLFWAAAFIALGKLLMRHRLKRLIVQGG